MRSHGRALGERALHQALGPCLSMRHFCGFPRSQRGAPEVNLTIPAQTGGQQSWVKAMEAGSVWQHAAIQHL